MENNKDKLWANVGKAMHTALKLEKQMPQLKKIKEHPTLTAGAAVVGGYSKSSFPHSSKVAQLVDMIQRQSFSPTQGIVIGKYNAKTTADYNRHTNRLEYKTKPAYGIQLTKRF